MRFVELFNTLNELGVKLSRPTLSLHLHHLQKRRTIIRKRQGKQKVTYVVNWEKFKPLEQSIRHKENLRHYIENKERFKSLSIEEQAIYTIDAMALEDVHQLQLMIKNTIDPSKTFYNSLQMLFLNRIYGQYQSWLLESCRESKEKAQRISDKLESSIKREENELFERAKKTFENE